MSILYIAVGILIFGLLIAVHELGHFAAAKACGVKVTEFAVGMGPAIVKKQKGETLYSLRCIPFGGYCAMEGEDGESEDPRAFSAQKGWKRLIILAAGSLMNFVTGLVIVLILFSNAGGFRAPVIEGFMEGCPYESAEGLQRGDRFLRIDGKRVWQYYDVGELLAQGGEEHDIVVRRGGRRVRLEDFRMVPVEYEGQERKMYGFYFGVDAPTALNKLRYAGATTMEFVRMVWDALGQLVGGKVSVNDLAGPVGIVDMMAETGEQAESVSAGLYDIFYLGAFIAVNLAVMNMLPIPALDGGRIFFLLVTVLIEAVSKKKLDPRYEGYVHAAGMILLLALMAYVLFHDIFRIVTKT
jgi:regulator of sigma E protease